MKNVIGIVGLGIMGGAMAEALLANGYQVVGCDILPEPRRRLRKAGGKLLQSVAAVIGNSDIVILSLPSTAALRDVVGRIVATDRPPKRKTVRRSIVIETSTLPIADKELAMRRLKGAGFALLDCPISGTAVRMKEGAWTIFASGPEAAFRRAQPVLNVFTSNIPYVGAFGNGSRVKFLANHLVAIYNVATAESITLARKMGLDPRKVLELFGNSPVIGTGVFRLRGALMAARTYTPPTMKVEVWQKDMQVIGDMAKSLHCPTPLFSACVPIYNSAMALHLGQSDTASVCEVLGAMAGIGQAGTKH